MKKIFLLLAIAMFSQILLGQSDKVKIYGKVTYKGIPVKDVIVLYRAYDGTEPINSFIKAVSDANGDYSLSVPKTDPGHSDGYQIITNNYGTDTPYVDYRKFYNNASNYKKDNIYLNIELTNYNIDYVLKGKITSNGYGIANAKVSVRFDNGDFSARTDSYGNYSIDLVKHSRGNAPNRYTISVSSDNYELYSTERQFDINSSTITQNITLEAKSTNARVHGKVTYNGTGVSNVEVAFYDYYVSNKTYKTTTDSYGNYSISIPRDISYIATADHGNYNTAKKDRWSPYSKEEVCNFEFTKYYPSSNSSSGSDGSAAGAVIVGAAIAGAVAGIASSSSSSSGGSKKTGPEPGIRNYKNVEIIDVKYTNGTHFMYASATLKVRNMNSYAVVVRLQCRYCSYEWENGRYIKEITIPAREIRTVEITGIQNVDFYDARILSVQ